MAKLTDLEKVRKKRARKRMRKNLVLLALFAAAVFGALSLIKKAEDVDFATLYSDLRADLSGSGEGYPVPLPGGKILKLQNAQENMLLLTDTNLYTYSMTGKQMLNAQHGMSNPVLSQSKARTLLYDRGGSKFSLYSKSALVHSGAMEFPIYAGDIAANENFALVTGSDRSLALVSVYSNPKKEPIFLYWSARMVMDVSLSENQNAMVIACVDAQDGDYLSSVSRFQFSIEKEMGRADLPGELVLGIDWYNNNTIRVVTDKRAILFDNDLRQLGAYDFSGQKIERFEFRPDGGMLLVFGSYAEDKRLRLVTLDSRFEKQGDYTAGYEIVCAKADANYLYIASSNQVEIVTLDGIPLAELGQANLHNIQPVGDQLFVADNMQISVSSVKELIARQQEADREAAASSREEKEAGGEESRTADGPEPQEGGSGPDVSDREQDSSQEGSQSDASEDTASVQEQPEASSQAEPESGESAGSPQAGLQAGSGAAAQSSQ